MEAKDTKDIVAILEDHDLGHRDDKETLNVDYIADLCGLDWGLFETVTSNLQKVRQFIEDDVYVQCVGMEATELVRRVDVILDSLTCKKKGSRWRARAILGKKLRWYRRVSEEAVEA